MNRLLPASPLGGFGDNLNWLRDTNLFRGKTHCFHAMATREKTKKLQPASNLGGLFR